MNRKVLMPLLAVALLAGCATDYSYRGGSGDYYYGRPYVEYRYENAYYGGAYGYGGFGYRPFGFDPWGYNAYWPRYPGYWGSYGYGRPYPPPYLHRPPHHRGDAQAPGPVSPPPAHGGTAPWMQLDRIPQRPLRGRPAGGIESADDEDEGVWRGPVPMQARGQPVRGRMTPQPRQTRPVTAPRAMPTRAQVSPSARPRRSSAED